VELNDRSLEEMEKVARDAALEAGELIRSRFGKAFLDVERKSPFDYVTDVDKESESIVVEALLHRYPDHSVVAEETRDGALPGGLAWVVDPLDGTANFIHGFPMVAVSIALCLDGREILAVVLDPLRRELFTARRNGGAFLNDRPVRVREEAALDRALLATGFPFRHRRLLDPYLDLFREIFSGVSDVRRAGAAALDLAYLASGRLDGFWEAGLKPWDVAAGSLLVQEAGGLASDFRGEDGYLRSGHIVAGSPRVFEYLHRCIRPSDLAARLDR